MDDFSYVFLFLFIMFVKGQEQLIGPWGAEEDS